LSFAFPGGADFSHKTRVREKFSLNIRRYSSLTRVFRFRVIDEQDKMRAHMRFFVNGEQVFDMTHPLRTTDAVQIVQALSGG
jgi:hypothetical protein